MDNLTQERRKFPRLNLRIPLHYSMKAPLNFGDALIEDIGEGGVRMIFNDFVKPNTNLFLEFSLPGQNTVIDAVGRVAWAQRIPHSDYYHIGTEFLEIDPKNRRDIAEFILSHTGFLPSLSNLPLPVLN